MKKCECRKRALKMYEQIRNANAPCPVCDTPNKFEIGDIVLLPKSNTRQREIDFYTGFMSGFGAVGIIAIILVGVLLK